MHQQHEAKLLLVLFRLVIMKYLQNTGVHQDVDKSQAGIYLMH